MSRCKAFTHELGQVDKAPVAPGREVIEEFKMGGTWPKDALVIVTHTYLLKRNIPKTMRN